MTKSDRGSAGLDRHVVPPVSGGAGSAEAKPDHASSGSVRSGETSDQGCDAGAHAHQGQGDGMAAGDGGRQQGGGGSGKQRRYRHEDAFWKGFIETSAPGWKATVVPTGLGGIGLAGMETFFYAVDTRTGWVNAAGFPAAQVEKMIEKIVALEPAPGVLPMTAISKITELGLNGADQDCDDARLAMMSTIGAMSMTQTLASVRSANGNLKGHFAYLVNTPSRGTPFSRPLFAMPPDEGFMSLELLFELVAEWMRRDMFMPGSEIYNTIQSVGPLMVCEGLQQLIER